MEDPAAILQMYADHSNAIEEDIRRSRPPAVIDIQKQNRLHRARKYRISLEALEYLLSQAKCDICGSSDPRSKYGWHIDHDHKTGKIRGILCHRYNVFLVPMLEHHPKIVEKALLYLENPPGIGTR